MKNDKLMIDKIKFFHSVKCVGRVGDKTEFTYFDHTSGYDIILDGVIVTIRHKELGGEVYSTLHNVIFFTKKE